MTRARRLVPALALMVATAAVLAVQPILPEFTPGPEIIATRARALARLRAKVARLETAGQLGDTTIDEAVFAFQGLCEGVGNIELRGNTLRLLPSGGEEDTWRSAFRRLVRGVGVRATSSPPGLQPRGRRR